MFKKFLIWLNSFFIQQKNGLHSSYLGSAEIREYVEEDPLYPVLQESARLDALKISDINKYLDEIVQLSIVDIHKKIVPTYGYDFIISERLAEMLQNSTMYSNVINTFKYKGLFVTFVNGSEEIPLPFLKVYLLES